VANSTSTLTRRTTLSIRPARWDDMEAVADFIRSTADWYRPFVSEKDMIEHEVPPEWKAKNFDRRDFYVGEADDQQVGTISLQYFGDYAYVGYVYLDEAFVGRGFGQQLLRYALDKARKKGMKGVALIAHPKATWATKAYVKFGFEKVASDREQVRSWNGGALASYYEEGFELYIYDLDR